MAAARAAGARAVAVKVEVVKAAVVGPEAVVMAQGTLGVIKAVARAGVVKVLEG